MRDPSMLVLEMSHCLSLLCQGIHRRVVSDEERINFFQSQSTSLGVQEPYCFLISSDAPRHV